MNAAAHAYFAQILKEGRQPLILAEEIPSGSQEVNLNEMPSQRQENEVNPVVELDNADYQTLLRIASRNQQNTVTPTEPHTDPNSIRPR